MTVDAIIIGSGPGGATAADVLTAAGLVRGHHGEGPQPPARPRRPDQAVGRLLQRRDQVHRAPLPRPRPADRAADLPAPTPTEGEHTHVGEVNSHPDHGRRRRDPRRRQGAALPRGRLPAPLDLGPQHDADVADWPLDYDELEPYYAEVERAIGVAGRAGANPFAAWRSGPYPMPSGAPMYGAVLSAAAAERLGLPPLPGADGGQQRPLRRPAGLQQLRVLRLLRLPHPRQGRPGRPAAPGHGHRAGRAAGRDLRSRGSVTEGRRATGVDLIGPDGVDALHGRPLRDRGRRRHRDARGSCSCPALEHPPWAGT